MGRRTRSEKANAFIAAIYCREHGYVVLEQHDYIRQMEAPDDRWRCPCGRVAEWAGNE